jgi:hypothetical protein
MRREVLTWEEIEKLNGSRKKPFAGLAEVLTIPR